MGSIIGGGGGGGGPAPDTTTQFIREAPGIEERKLELMDLARQTAQSPISIPDIQVQGLSPLEQAAITQAGQTGVGAGAVGQAITGTQAAMGAPNISQFYNPYQSYVLDEINRQSAMRQNVLAGQAVGAGAFGGGRQGIQTAEEERARLGQLGQAQAVGFQSALQAAQQQQAAQRAGSAQLGTLGQLQQEMAGTDISRQITAGGLQRQLGQAQLDASRQTQLQRSAEPLQRLEFLSNIYAAGPKSTSGITAATLPQSSPLAQSIGTGLGVAQAYQGMQNPAAQTTLAKFNEGGIVSALKVRKFNEGGSTDDDDDISDELLKGKFTGNTPTYISDAQRFNIMTRPLPASLLKSKKTPGQSEASAVAEALGGGLEKQQEAALELTKYDAAVQAAKEKAKGKQVGGVIPESEWRKIPGLEQLPIGSVVQRKSDGTYSITRTPKGEADSKVATIEAIQQIGKIRNLYESSGKPTGYFESSIKRTANKLFGTNPDLASLDSTLELFNANFLKAMRGVQVSGIEQVKFEQILPNMNDAETVFEKKMDAVEEMLIIRDKLQSGEITREEFLDIVNNTYNKSKSKISSGSTKVEKDGSVTVGTGG